jgi:hypothetical protein
MVFNKIKLFAFALFLIANISSVLALDENTDSVKAKADPSLEFSYLKKTDGSKSLICNVGVSINRRVYPVKNVICHFYTGNDFSVSLGSSVTNYKGKVVCTIPPKFNLTVNEEGKYSFKVEYSGNDTLEAASEELQVMDVNMEMVCKNEDSVKSVTVKMFRNEKGSEIPLKDETVSLYVQRMFSMLKIGEAKLDSAGYANFEFPSDLPGDSLGNLTILARLEEHSDYGNVEKSEMKKWGIATTKELLMETRALWTAVAPVWMIVTLTIMLLGVWAHYLYVVIHMIIIKNKGKEKHF